MPLQSSKEALDDPARSWRCRSPSYVFLILRFDLCGAIISVKADLHRLPLIVPYGSWGIRACEGHRSTGSGEYIENLERRGTQAKIVVFLRSSDGETVETNE